MMVKHPMRDMHIHMYFVGQIYMCFVVGDVRFVSNRCSFFISFFSIFFPFCHEEQSHFPHEPRAMTMRLGEPKRKCPKAVRTHLQNHLVWSRILKCNVKPYAIVPSTKCYFNEFLFMQIFTYDRIK